MAIAATIAFVVRVGAASLGGSRRRTAAGVPEVPDTGRERAAMRPAEGRAEAAVRPRRVRVLRLAEIPITPEGTRDGGSGLPTLAGDPDAPGILAGVPLVGLSGPRPSRRVPLGPTLDAGVTNSPRLVRIERLPAVDVPAAPSTEGIPLPILLRAPRPGRHAVQDPAVRSFTDEVQAVPARHPVVAREAQDAQIVQGAAPDAEPQEDLPDGVPDDTWPHVPAQQLEPPAILSIQAVDG